jgi:tetratricopeptide (TPR) repeat protein
MTLSFLTDDMMMQLFGKYADEANSEKLPAHLNLSACYLKLQRHNEAIDQACRALGVEPKNPKAFYRRGRAKQALGEATSTSILNYVPSPAAAHSFQILADPGAPDDSVPRHPFQHCFMLFCLSMLMRGASGLRQYNQGKMTAPRRTY